MSFISGLREKLAGFHRWFYWKAAAMSQLPPFPLHEMFLEKKPPLFSIYQNIYSLSTFSQCLVLVGLINTLKTRITRHHPTVLDRVATVNTFHAQNVINSESLVFKVATLKYIYNPWSKCIFSLLFSHIVHSFWNLWYPFVKLQTSSNVTSECLKNLAKIVIHLPELQSSCC